MTTQHENCTEVIDQLMAKTLCSEPGDIAQALGITIKVEDLPYDVIGIYTEIGVRSFIVLNDTDDDEMQRYVTALCLYYHLTNSPRILLRTGPVDGNFDAARFAYSLLTHDRPEKGEKAYIEYEEETGIPQIIIDLAKRRLN